METNPEANTAEELEAQRQAQLMQIQKAQARAKAVATLRDQGEMNYQVLIRLSEISEALQVQNELIQKALDKKK